MAFSILRQNNIRVVSGTTLHGVRQTSSRITFTDGTFYDIEQDHLHVASQDHILELQRLERHWYHKLIGHEGAWKPFAWITADVVLAECAKLTQD